jgi:hypothetical protein
MPRHQPPTATHNTGICHLLVSCSVWKAASCVPSVDALHLCLFSGWNTVKILQKKSVYILWCHH